jgi:hypothetical protein
MGTINAKSARCVALSGAATVFPARRNWAGRVATLEGAEMAGPHARARYARVARKSFEDLRAIANLI